MKFIPSRGTLCVLLLGATAQLATAQDMVGQLKNDLRNTFSQQPAASYPPQADFTATTARPTGSQFTATSSIGGWIGHPIKNSSGTQLAGPTTSVAGPTTSVAGPTTLQLPADANGLKLGSVSMGRGLLGRKPDAYFGDVLLPPNVDDQGATVNGLTAYHAEPADSGDFYFSAASNQVFASQAGVVVVKWRLKSNDQIVPVPYIVAAGTHPAKPPRRIYWTKNGFKGIPVNVPDSVRLSIVYNREVPTKVATEFRSPYENTATKVATQLEPRTLWRDQAHLHAYNVEGMVLLELSDSENRFLGTEVVQIIREAPPVLVKAHIGTRLLSLPPDETLRPQVVTGFTSTPFVDLVALPSRNEIHLYATRTTSPMPLDAFGNERASGELTVFWLKKGLGEMEWPMIFNTYIISWPTTSTPNAYTTFIRQDSTDGDSAATAVRLDATNNPQLLFQDDPFGTQTLLESGVQFYSRLSTADRDGLSLIRHQIGEEVWYERIHSMLATDRPEYTSTNFAEVGKRLEPPAGLGLQSIVGYVRLHPTDSAKRKYRSAFDPSAFIDPFALGFEAAKQGAIIPTNARSVVTTTGTYQDELEVWWYQASTPPQGTAFRPNYFPVRAMVYTNKWPTDSETIVLASNKGSGPLAAPQATGRIYYENDDTKVGFNPNDEHALILGDTVWALRDDLGTSATSQPLVLLRYTASDARPAMRAWRIQREDTEADPPIVFRYTVEAGKRLNPPMPIAAMLPLYNGNAPANYEEPAVKAPLPANTTAPEHYGKFTYTDRKGGIWIYRGPHTAAEEGQSFDMKFFYAAQDGFYLPGANPQPKAGAPMPYLRRLPASASGEELEAFAKATDNQGFNKQSVGITYVPVWPAFAPTMRMGETLTNPRYGLPAIRGQTSVGVLYEQATAAAATKSSVTLFDPTVAKMSRLDATSVKLTKLPDSVVGNLYQGKIYFPNLPPHLSERLYLDPNQGARGALVLKGKFIDEVLGADYLHLNVLSAKDVRDVKALCDSADADKDKWYKLVDELSVDAVRHVHRTAKPGTFDAYKPQGDTATKANLVWNFLRSVSWRSKAAPLTQKEIADGSGISAAEGNLDLATAWVAENFATLSIVDQMRAGSTPAGTATLYDRAFGELSPRAPASGRLANQVYQSVNYQWKGSKGIATDWAAFQTGRAAARALADWIMDQPWSTPAGDALTETSIRGVTAKTWSVTAEVTDPGSGASYFNLAESATAGLLTVELTNSAWKFVTTYRAQLKEWDKGRSSATSPTALIALLETDYRRAESNARVAINGLSIVESTHDDVAVDSYALAADGGEGWVTLIMGNGRAFTPAAEPISMYVIRVEKPLASGEIKVVQSTNPLAEKLTMQSSNDFGGKPEQYEFQWKTLPPVDGLPPAVYSFSRSLLMGDGSWLGKYQDDSTGAVSLPSNVAIAGASPQPPLKSLTRSFILSALPYRAFLSFTLGQADGVSASINGTVVALRNYPDSVDTVTAAPPLSTFTPLTHFIELPVSTLKTGANQLRLDLVTTAPAGTASLLNCRLETLVHTDLTDTWNAVPNSPDDVTKTLGVEGKNRLVIEGQSLFTLTDNYFIYRYRPISDQHDARQNPPSEGWSNWTEPQLGEGWIKRALAGINPFEQRMKDLYNNAVNTDVSLVSQAGKRWEGDVALNLQNINNYGLIEIYETILRRGKMLSIEGAPAINYAPANDALMLAAGYLNDLYMILGNEAYADAQNSTIAYGTDSGQLGDTASAQFAFKGQLASVLDEELTLLRGRDDLLAPGTRVTPVFNRLIWNYTRGIASGEVVYALNYNIKDLNADGSVNAADAAKAYPQGHGDAYGHYLMALKNYYSLLWNPNFAWIPRIEAVLVLGKPVSVDYLDERKFAGAAAAWAKTTAQTLDLTYRQSYNPAAKGTPEEPDPAKQIAPTWAHLGNLRENNRTAVIRTWGVDDWAVRGGQGAFFHWLSASAMLPETDPDPNHEGIQKIDRSTVPEIGEIAAQANVIQGLLDNADKHLNPLGLSDGAVPFDITINALTDWAGQPHYEEIYERARTALANASTAFDRAKGATALLRSQDETLDDKRDSIFAQERAFESQLIELYGTPYTDDIGPGKLYEQDYTGPDLLHYMYVEMPELMGNNLQREEKVYKLVGGNTKWQSAIDTIDKWGAITADPKSTDSGDLADRVLLGEEKDDLEDVPAGAEGVAKNITYTLDGTGDFVKPASWTGRRAYPGAIQQAVSELLMARLQLANDLENYGYWIQDFRRAARKYMAAMAAHQNEKNRMIYLATQSNVFADAKSAIDVLLELNVTTKILSHNLNDAGKELAKSIAGTASTVNAPTVAALTLQEHTKDSFGDAVVKTLKIAKNAIDILERGLQVKYGESGYDKFDIAWRAEHLQLITDLKTKFGDLQFSNRPMDMSLRRFNDTQEKLRALVAKGDTIQREREFFRRRSAAIIHGAQTKDLGFRIFRDEALESYRSLFDLASRYTYLAARAYDYETALLDPVRSSTAKGFLQDIVKARAVGVFTNGVPQATSTTTGDPGLAGVLARMNADWSVAKPRLGLNNPARSQTIFSLRREMARIDPGAEGDVPWKDYLASCRRANLLADQDVKRHCLNLNPRNLLTVPGYVIEFSTTIEEGVNFFGNPLMGGDQTFSPSAFANKIRAAGIGFKGYIGMASPTSIGGSIESPNDPGTGFSDPNALSATPYVYLIPSGMDSMRAPSNTDVNIVRSWMIEDQAIPLPFDIGGAFSSSNAISGFATLREQFTLRKHGAFRAVPGDTVFSSATNFTSTRLISRSVWNSKWKIVIPGSTLLAEPINGMAKFLQQVKDIQLYFDSYSAAGN